jgi:dGTPase
VHDLVEHSRAGGDIVQSERIGGAMSRLRRFMFDRVYLGSGALQEQGRVTAVIETLFEHYLATPEAIESVAGTDSDDLGMRVTDYIAGMTDRFCIRKFEALTIPREFRY